MPVSSKKVFYSRNIKILWLSLLVSASGDAIYQIALIWLVLDISGSSSFTGLVAMSAYLPAMLFGLYAGVLSDKYDRLRLMIISNLNQALTVLLIPFLLFMDIKAILLIGVLAFIRSAFSTIFPPSLNSLIPTIVPRDQIVRTNSLITTSHQLAYLIGPGIAGLLLSFLSINGLFIIDGLSFVVSIALLKFVRVPRKKVQPVRSASSWKELKNGFLFVMKNRNLSLMFFLTVINNLFIMGPAIVGMPIFIKDYLHGTSSDWAYVEACMGLGMLIGSILVYRFGSLINNGRLLAFGMILDGITYTFFYFVHSVPVAWILITIHGAAIPMITIGRTAIIHTHTENRYHGRLFSMVHLSVVGVTAVSSALIGIIASFAPIQWIFFYIGIGAALCGIIAISIKSFRELT